MSDQQPWGNGNPGTPNNRPAPNQYSGFPTQSPMAAERRAQGNGPNRGRGQTRWALILIPIALLVLGLAILGAVLGFRLLGDEAETATNTSDEAMLVGNDEDLTPNPDSSSDPASPAGSDDASTDPLSEEPAADLIVPDADPSRMVMELKNYQFYISGVVPDQETADAIAERTAVVYREFGTANIVVDPSVPRQPWMDATPDALRGLWTLIEGKIEITETETIVDGYTNKQVAIDQFLESVAADDGFPPVTNNIEIVDLNTSTIDATRDPATGIVRLTGTVPSQKLIDNMELGLNEYFGEENVVNEMQVLEGTFARFGIIRFADTIATFRFFDQFSIGIANDKGYGTFENGLNFDTASSTLKPELKEKLQFFPPFFARFPWPVQITGHTDNQGSPASNLQLSEARAQSLADYFIAEGLQPERVVIIAKGEEEPIASNETEEGRAQNRRVLFTWGQETP